MEQFESSTIAAGDLADISVENSSEYLRPTYFLDADQNDVRAFAEKHTSGASTPQEKAIRLYNAVRDGWYYNPYLLDLRLEGLQASRILQRNHAYCVEKAVLLAAVARAVGIPSRLSFYNVRNHIATERIERFLKTDILVFHGATELFLHGRWLKATPAFNAALCQKMNVDVLEFSGYEDSIFQQYDRSGNTFMHYLHEYGAFSDLPYTLFLDELVLHYGAVINRAMLEQHGYVLNLQAMIES